MQNIPEDKLPSEYKDKERLDSLFSPLRNKSVNPKDWDSKIESWKHLIYLYCVNNEIYSFSLQTLSKALTRHGRPPSCLNVVIEELIRNGELQPLSEFLRKTPNTWNGYLTDLLVKKPATWSFNVVKNALWKSEGAATDVNFVHLTVVDEESHKLLQKIPEKFKNRVISINDLITLLSTDSEKASNVKLLLHHLEKRKKVAVTDVANVNKGGCETLLMKFGGANDVNTISETEVGIYVLEQNEKLFTDHVLELEDSVKKCVDDVKVHLLKGNRQLAKTLLKKKHEIERRLVKKANALHNIQVLLEQLKDAQINGDIWQTYKDVLTTYNATVAQTGLNEDAVEDTMLKLSDALETHDDIQAAISRPLLNDNESDLEEELVRLINEPSNVEVKDASTDSAIDTLEEEMGKLNISLPEVPETNVSVKESSQSC